METRPVPAAPQEIQATFCATLVDEWVRSGLVHAVVCPGSRSTPLALALLADTRIEVRVVLDERSAGFVALGIGMATGRPAVLLTTSGTAAVELHPAVVEADLARVPLVVVTADRPPELHGIGAPQTVDQMHLFGRAVRWFFDPGAATQGADASWRSIAARAVAEACDGPRGPGPVHMNLPFREPLLGAAGPLPAGRPEGAGWHTTVRPALVLQEADAERLAARLTGRRGIFVVGGGVPAEATFRAGLLRLAVQLGWPVLADPRSGCRVGDDLVAGATVVAAADAVLRSPLAARRLRPEVVVRMGSPWASKVLAQFLAAASAEGAEDLLVDPYGAWNDPARTASLVVGADPAHFVTGIAAASIVPAPKSWSEQWCCAEQAAQDAIDDVLGRVDADCAEPALARQLMQWLPDGSLLVTSSSMPVRDVEWYGARRSGLTVLANRGANGIDGVTSTVMGVASARSGPTVGLLGDLAFLHDTTALLTAATGMVDATLVVVDNGGGGIFEFLPQAAALDRPRFERLFGTAQPVDVAAVAAAYGLAVCDVRSVRDAVAAVGADQARPGVGVVVIRTDRVANVSVHDRIHASAVTAVESALGG